MVMSSAPLLLALLLLLPGEHQQAFGIKDITVSEDGIYICTLITDALNSTDLVANLAVNGVPWFRAIATDGVLSGFDLALPLKKGDRVSSELVNGTYGPHSQLAAVLASGNESSYRTVFNVSTEDFDREQSVSFMSMLGADQVVHSQDDYNFYIFDIPATGIYWVMLRAMCVHRYGWAHLFFSSKIRYFLNICLNDYAVSASAAIYLTEGSQVRMEYFQGREALQPQATSFSFVHLSGNNATALGRPHSYMAHTSYALKIPGNVSWGVNVTTNYGDMYNVHDRVFRIKVTGKYLVSIRGSPMDVRDLEFYLHINQHATFTAFAQNNKQSGQTFVMRLREGDILYVTCNDYRLFLPHTLMSIAFVWIEV